MTRIPVGNTFVLFANLNNYFITIILFSFLIEIYCH